MKAETPNNKTLIAYSPVRWGLKLWTDRHHLFYWLSRKGFNIIYTKGPYFSWEVRRNEWSNSSWLGGINKVQLRGLTEIGVYDAGKIIVRWPRKKFIDDLMLNLHVKKNTVSGPSSR